ncbi:MAG: electron transfer flavoprotein subunit alpha/FixB family protein [Terracidiphilus sp.]
MESILVLTHCDETGEQLSKGSLEAVTAGRELSTQLGATLTIGIVCGSLENLAKSISSAGARLLVVSGEAFTQPRYASDAAACEAICRTAQPTIVLAPHSSRFARVMAAVAHRVHGCIDTHITAIIGAEEIHATRWFYRQRMEAVVTRELRPWFLLLDSGTHEAYAAVTAPARVEQIAVEVPALRTTVLGTRAPEQGAIPAGTASDGSSRHWETIRPDAKLLFVAGAGWTKKQPDGKIHVAEAGELILQFAHASGASLGSSKSLVDQGSEGTPVLPFLTHLNQVGQTGSTPRHPKGLATCCHGEEPHVVGWRFVGERRAISLDPNCGWTRGKADVVYVADAFQVIKRVNSLLGTKVLDGVPEGIS